MAGGFLEGVTDEQCCTEMKGCFLTMTKLKDVAQIEEQSVFSGILKTEK